MTFRNFLKDKVFSITLLVFTLITVEIFLWIYHFGIGVKIYTCVSILLAYMIGLVLEYHHKKNYYQELLEKLDKLDQKYLIAELVKEADFLEGNILREILQETNKSMLEQVNDYKKRQEEYQEYIELWIHEIKIPIATSKLMMANHPSNITASIEEEIEKIENYIEQALYYARSNQVEKDYLIRKCDLKEIVYMAIKKNQKQLISSNIQIQIEELERQVYVDRKWLLFILHQILNNSIQYARSAEKKLHIFSEEKKDQVILYIEDNGIGIKESELACVFEKGFTGSNGRERGKKSTGIGLYLSKKLCDKLGIGLEMTSILGEGTTVKIIFPKNSHIPF